LVKLVIRKVVNLPENELRTQFTELVVYAAKCHNI